MPRSCHRNLAFNFFAILLVFVIIWIFPLYAYIYHYLRSKFPMFSLQTYTIFCLFRFVEMSNYSAIFFNIFSNRSFPIRVADINSHKFNTLTVLHCFLFRCLARRQVLSIFCVCAPLFGSMNCRPALLHFCKASFTSLLTSFLLL